MGDTKQKIHFAWWVLVGLAITVGLGKAALNNTAGLFLTPVSNDIGVGIGTLTLYLSISSIATMFFLPIGGKLMAKHDSRVILTAGIILQGGAFAIFGLLNHVWGWYIFAIPFAVGAVLINIIAGPVLIDRWFKKRKGLALGILSAIGGLMGAFIQPVVGNLIVSLGWRGSYIAVGLGVILITIPAIIFLLRKNPAEKKLKPYGEDEVTNDDAKNNSGQTNTSGIESKVAKKSLAFIALGIFFFVITAVASFVQHIPTYLISQGYDISFSGNIMSATMIGLFIGSLLFGFLADKIGAKNTALLAMLLGIIGTISLILFPNILFMLVLAVMMFGFIMSAIGTVGPALTSALFGSRDYSQIYATASVGMAVAGIITLPAYGYIFDFTGSYTGALYAILVMLIINIVCIIVAFKDKDKMVKNNLWHA